MPRAIRPRGRVRMSCESDADAQGTGLAQDGESSPISRPPKLPAKHAPHVTFICRLRGILLHKAACTISQ